MAAVEGARAAAEAQLEAARTLPAAYLRAVFNSPEAQKWPKKRLGDLCSVHPGQHILEADYNSKGFGVCYLTGPADFGEKRPTITKWTEMPKAWCEPGDILITVKGAGVGKLNLAPDFRVAIGRQLMALRPNGDSVRRDYLYFLLITHFSKLQADALGSTVPGLSRENIESLTIPCPPLPEQKNVASILDKNVTEARHVESIIMKQMGAINQIPTALLRRAFKGEL